MDHGNAPDAVKLREVSQATEALTSSCEPKRVTVLTKQQFDSDDLDNDSVETYPSLDGVPIEVNIESSQSQPAGSNSIEVYESDPEARIESIPSNQTDDTVRSPSSDVDLETEKPTAEEMADMKVSFGDATRTRTETESYNAEDCHRRRNTVRQVKSSRVVSKTQPPRSSPKKSKSMPCVDINAEGPSHEPRRLAPLKGFLADSRCHESGAADEELNRTASTNSGMSHTALSLEDIEICRKLDDEYERALEDREVGYNARFHSVRQSAFVSVFFMFGYLALGTAFFMRQADWSVPESLLFSIYTVTTVGYGSHSIPKSGSFQAYTVFYILIGIAALTIMVAQVYQCIALEASRAQHARDKTEMARRGLDILRRSVRKSKEARGNIHGEASADEIISYHQANMPGCLDHTFRCFDRAKGFFRNNQLGRGMSVLFPFLGLVLSGAIVVGPIEGWSIIESIYFSVVTLTTVGFGDYVPTRRASIWFCIVWMPFSVGFMSVFLGNVAAFYIRLSDKNIHRIERQMRRRMKRAKDQAEQERAEVLKRAYRGQELSVGDDGHSLDSDSEPIPHRHASLLARKQRGFDMLPTKEGMDSDEGSDGTLSSALFGSRKGDSGTQRRSRIIENSMSAPRSSRPEGRTMQSMKDVVGAVRRNLSLSESQDESRMSIADRIRRRKDLEYMSIRSTSSILPNTTHRREAIRKPSFALRVLVQERFAEIIATDIAGFQSSIEIKENTLSVTIDTLKDTADKWLVPRRARKAFRAVAFEALYFVGEHGLITRGADALFDLSPFEFHGLFSPLLASMGDAETMEGWLASTDILADVDLRRDGTRPGLATIPQIGAKPHFDAAKQTAVDERLEGMNAAAYKANKDLRRLTPGNAFSVAK